MNAHLVLENCHGGPLPPAPDGTYGAAALPGHPGPGTSPAGGGSGCRTDDAAAARVEAGAAEGVIAGPAEPVPVRPCPGNRPSRPLTRSGTSHRECEHGQQSAGRAHPPLAVGTGPSRTPQWPAFPALWGSRPHRRLRCTRDPWSHADEEARVGWVWAVVVVWVLLAAPAAVLLGRTIHRADREELEAPTPDPDQVHRQPARTRRPGRDPFRHSPRGVTAA
jgi:hypothetical protein